MTKIITKDELNKAYLPLAQKFISKTLGKKLMIRGYDPQHDLFYTHSIHGFNHVSDEDTDIDENMLIEHWMKGDTNPDDDNYCSVANYHQVARYGHRDTQLQEFMPVIPNTGDFKEACETLRIAYETIVKDIRAWWNYAIQQNMTIKQFLNEGDN